MDLKQLDLNCDLLNQGYEENDTEYVLRDSQLLGDQQTELSGIRNNNEE